MWISIIIHWNTSSWLINLTKSSRLSTNTSFSPFVMKSKTDFIIVSLNSISSYQRLLVCSEGSHLNNFNVLTIVYFSTYRLIMQKKNIIHLHRAGLFLELLPQLPKDLEHVVVDTFKFLSFKNFLNKIINKYYHKYVVSKSWILTLRTLKLFLSNPTYYLLISLWLANLNNGFANDLK